MFRPRIWACELTRYVGEGPLAEVAGKAAVVVRDVGVAVWLAYSLLCGSWILCRSRLILSGSFRLYLNLNGFVCLGLIWLIGVIM